MKRTITAVCMVIVMMGTMGVVHAADNEILGAGATFPQPLYSKMFDTYYKLYHVKVNYQGIGSGAGIEQLTRKTVDFGATDSFMKDGELKKAPAAIVHVPVALGAVAVTYNLPGNPTIKLSREALAGIFLGTIKRWNDKAISAVNPGVKLPGLPITVIHRSDGSGTTAVFTEFLSKISPVWNTKVGSGKEVAWPAGLGAKGNAGVSGQVQKLPGSIGYVELVYALENRMAIAEIQNKKGNYIKPSLESTKLSAELTIPEDTRASLVDTDAPKGYPITGLTWIIVYREQGYGGRSMEKAKVLVNLLWWMTHEGQKYCEPLNYAPIPGPVVKKAEKIITSVTYGGKSIKK